MGTRDLTKGHAIRAVFVERPRGKPETERGREALLRDTPSGLCL